MNYYIIWTNNHEGNYKTFKHFLFQEFFLVLVIQEVFLQVRLWQQKLIIRAFKWAKCLRFYSANELRWDYRDYFPTHFFTKPMLSRHFRIESVIINSYTITGIKITENYLWMFLISGVAYSGHSRQYLLTGMPILVTKTDDSQGCCEFIWMNGNHLLILVFLFVMVKTKTIKQIQL